MSVVSDANSKKRKKPESKPQSQLNKCLNEKRRREQENTYIEELAELISASISDMSSLSVKPDKCAILQETVNQIRRIKQESRHCDDLQQSEVSSSKPAILGNDVLGPLLLEALDGFLFVVNTDGKIEFVSENITSFLKYSQDELMGDTIYNFIHLGDHGRFSSSLLPMSLGNGFGWTTEASSVNCKSRSFNCRFQLKLPDKQDETMEEKQMQVTQYENMQVSAVLLPYPGEKADSPDSNPDAQNYLVCVARRIPPNEKSPAAVGVEQFTTRLDLTGKILAVDTSGVSSTYSQYLNKDLVGRVIQELCHPSDLPKLSHHLKETLQTGSNTSSIYRLQVAHEKYVLVQTKSKRFAFNQVTNEQEFIMATHSIIRDGDQSHPSDCHSSGSQRNIQTTDIPVTCSSTLGSALTQASLGGNVNGGLNGPNMTGSSVLASSSSSYPSFSSISPSAPEFTLDLGLEMFPGASWDVGSGNGRESAVSEGLTSGLPPSSLGGSRSTGGSPVAHSTSTTVTSCSSSSGHVSTQNSQSISQQQPSSTFSPDIMSGKASPMTRSPHAQLSSTSSPVAGHATPFSNYPYSPIPAQPQPSTGKGSPCPPSTSIKKEENSGSAMDVPGLSPVMSMSGYSENQTQKLRNLLTQGLDEADCSPAPSSVIKAQAGEVSDVPTSTVECEMSTLRVSHSISGDGMTPSSSSRNENIILRELLNQDDEDLTEMTGKASQRINDKSLPSTNAILVDQCKNEPSESYKRPVSSSNNNNMLRQLLNNSEDSDKSYRKSQDLLIQQLLKAESPEKVENLGCSGDDAPTVRQPPSDVFLKQLGLDSSHPSHSSGIPASAAEVVPVNIKRKVPDDSLDSTSDQGRKKPTMSPGHHAHLAGQNPMLASMLAQTPSTVPAVPTSIATSIMSQLPQERLPKNLEKKLIHTPYPGTTGSTATTTSTATSVQNRPLQNPPRGLLASSPLQQEVVTADSRGHITLAPHSTATALTAGPTLSLASSISLVQQQQQPHPNQQGFLSKILSSQENSLHRGHSTSSSLASGLSALQQASSSFTQFTQVCHSLSQGNAVPAIGLSELLESGSNISQASDPILSQILDEVWSMQQEMNMETATTDDTMLLQILDEVLDPPTPPTAVPHTLSSSPDMNEKMAISAIQRQLMSFEMPTGSGAVAASQGASATARSVRTPPLVPSQLSPTALAAYSSSATFSTSPQLPTYSGGVVTSQRPRVPGVGLLSGNQQIVGLTTGPRPVLQQFAAAMVAGGTLSVVSPQMRRSLLERRQKLYLQQQQKRLLAQQQQQQLTMQTQQSLADPLSLQGSSPFPENMNELLNNTVAPNVTLQRSASLPEQQLSPHYGNSVMNQLPSATNQPPPSQLSPGQRVNHQQQQQPYSPLSGQPFPSPSSSSGSYQQSQSQHRLSPHPYPQGTPGPSPSPVQVPASGPRSPHLQLSPQPGSTTQWSQRPPPSPIPGSLQQQNPMLNAQLSQGTYSNQSRFASPQRQIPLRSMPSPTSIQVSRSSPYHGQGENSFPHSPVSSINMYQQQQTQQQQTQPSPNQPQHQTPQPSPQQPTQPTPQQQQTQQQRLQRTISMPGRVNSPRTPQGNFSSDPILSPQPQMSPGYSQSVPATPASSYPATSSTQPPTFNIIQDNVHFNFDQQSLQLFTSSSERTRGSSTGMPVSSEYVRQELRAMVGARTQQHQQQGQTQQSTQQALHQLHLNLPSVTTSTSQSLSQAELAAFGITLELSPGEGQPSSPALYSQPLLSIAGGQETTVPTRPRSTNSPRLEEPKQGDQKKSLLQQLLSEPS